MQWLLSCFKGKYLEHDDLMQRVQQYELEYSDEDYTEDLDQRIAA